MKFREKIKQYLTTKEYNPLAYFSQVFGNMISFGTDKNIDFATAVRNIAFAMINIRANTFANEDTIVESKGNTNWIETIIDKPNNFYNWMQLKYMLQFWLDITGNAYLHTPLFPGSRFPLTAYILPSTKIKIKIDNTNGDYKIGYYEYQINSTKKIKIDPQEICHFKTMFVSDESNTLEHSLLYGQPHLLTASANAISTDKAVAEHILKSFKRDAVAPFILNTKERIAIPEWERKQAQWIAAFKDYPLKAIMQNGESIEQLPTGTANIISNLTGNVDDYILLHMCSIWGIPKSKILSKYENKDTAQVNENVFRTQVIEPLLRNFDEKLTSHYRQFDKNISIIHKPYSYVDPKTQIEENKFYLMFGIKSRNEIRESLKLPMIPNGDEYLILGSLQKYDEIGNPLPNLPKKSIEKSINNKKKIDIKNLYWKNYNNKIDRDKKVIADTVKKIYEFIQKDILLKMSKTKNIKAKSSYNFDMSIYDEMIKKSINPITRKIIIKQMKEALAEMDIEFVENDFDREIERIMKRGVKNVKTSTETIGKDLEKNTIGMSKNDAMNEIDQRFNNMYKKGKVNLVAETTTTFTLNSATSTVWEKNEISMSWLSMRDEKVRPAHRKADGQIRKNGNFYVGGESLPYPAGGMIAENNANCRCTLFPEN